ncbi:hypothetical protein BD560DRAFT_387424 [Blakeslea trispora]|nr:hypothetical protein BD560DRAFT_387424 [Blakeslea trispora]
MLLNYTTRIEDYHSDDDEDYTYSPSFRLNPNNLDNRNRRHPHHVDPEEEEELERGMYEMDLNAYRHPLPNSRPRPFDPSFDSRLAPSYSPRRRPPHYFMPPPPLQPLPHEHYRPWMHPMEDRSPFYSPVRRSSSSRSYMRRPSVPVPRRHYHEVYHDNEEDYSSEEEYPMRAPYGFPETNYLHDVSPARSYVSRQSSIGSSAGSGRNLPSNKRRSNSLSVPPGMPRFVYPSSPSVRRRSFQSVPSSPRVSDDSSQSVSSSSSVSHGGEEEERHYVPRRRLSLGSNMPPPFPPPPPPPQLRANRRFSFNGIPPPPPPPPGPPNMPSVVLPAPPMMDTVNPLPRRNSSFSSDFFPTQNPPIPPPLAAVAAAAAANAPSINDASTATMPMPAPSNTGNEMPPSSQPDPAWLNGFGANGSGNTAGLFHPMPMMGIAPMFNHPMIPPPPMWNMMNPAQQDPMWLGDFPFMNNQDPNLMTQTTEVNRKSPVNPVEMESMPPQASTEDTHLPEMVPPPPPPPPPMLQRGLSMLGGLFSGASYRRQPEFSTNSRDDFFPPPPQLMNSKKEAKLAKEYAKLGTFYCWRKLDGTDSHFESFSIPNQKIIKRKLAKNAPSQIMLGKEKKLPGEIMVDLQQNRGCYLGKINGEQFLVQLEIKEETYHPANTNSFVFATNENNWSHHA